MNGTDLRVATGRNCAATAFTDVHNRREAEAMATCHGGWSLVSICRRRSRSSAAESDPLWPQSFRLDARELHHLGPPLSFVSDEFAEVGR